MDNQDALDHFYKYYQSKPLKERKALEKQELYSLYKQPRADKNVNIPWDSNITPHIIYQADVLYMPEDPITKDKFILTVVDTGTGITQAIPLKEISPKSIINGFKKAFNGTILPKPKYLEVDAGSEFKGDTLKWLHDQGIMVKVSKVHRSRQVAYAESRNGSLKNLYLCV